MNSDEYISGTSLVNTPYGYFITNTAEEINYMGGTSAWDFDKIDYIDITTLIIIKPLPPI